MLFSFTQPRELTSHQHLVSHSPPPPLTLPHPVGAKAGALTNLFVLLQTQNSDRLSRHSSALCRRQDRRSRLRCTSGPEANLCGHPCGRLTPAKESPKLCRLLLTSYSGRPPSPPPPPPQQPSALQLFLRFPAPSSLLRGGKGRW